MTASYVGITVEREFSAAHRIEGHPKCGRLHGHNYRLVVTLEGHVTLLDKMGFLMDFKALKQIVDASVIDAVDHRYLVSDANVKAEDPYLAAAKKDGRHDDYCVLDIPQTSAEHLVRVFARAIFARLPNGVLLKEVSLWETTNNKATVSSL